MDTHLQFQVNNWLDHDPDPVTRARIESLISQNNQTELAQMFAGRLTFGTAGIRGIMGAGPMRMNRLVIQQTTAGLAQYLINQLPHAQSRGVVIGYDGRHGSKEFAHDAAGILTQMGFKIRLTADVAPTPLIAFGVTYFQAAAGVVITASHNPPKYNGYKVYWNNGAQIIPPHDTGIAARIDACAHQTLIMKDLDIAQQEGLLDILTEDFSEVYRKVISSKRNINSNLHPVEIGISHTALHGVGANLAEAILKDAGFTSLYPVTEQREPDGDFPTVNFPNPEEQGAMDLVIAEAKKHDAMLACANDPDADRFAVAVRNPLSEYQMLTGDQVGVLLGHYLLSHADLTQRLVGNTIVSSSLLGKVVKAMGGEHYETLTGFKWLMNVAQQKQTADCQFLFAYEEALGYAIGDTVWDKDGLTAQLAFAELSLELHAKGLSLWDRLEDIYRAHGLHLNSQVSIQLQPDTPNIGETLRQNPPEKIANLKIIEIEDLKSLVRSYVDGRKQAINLPSSDVLIYHLEDNSRVIVRPSGTEPKLKCYYEVIIPLSKNMSLVQGNQIAEENMSSLIAAHQASLNI